MKNRNNKILIIKGESQSSNIAEGDVKGYSSLKAKPNKKN
jgi:hypothetical protein